MRVLLINKFHYLRGGAERSYFETARVLREHGHEVAFFAIQHSQNLPTKWSRFFAPAVDFHAPISVWQKIILAVRVIYNRRAARNLEKLVLEFKPDVAHLHNIYHQLSPSIIYVLKKCHIPMVMTLHDYKLISPAYNLSARGAIYERAVGKSWYRCALDKCLHNSYLWSTWAVLESYLYLVLGVYKNIHIFIAPSIFLRDTFLRSGFKGRIAQLSNPLRVECVGGKKLWPNPYIFYAGRLSLEKGVADLVRAYARAQVWQLDLVICGSGPAKSELMALTKQLGVSEKVHFIGSRPLSDVYTFMQGAHAVVIPSQCYENAPYAAREASILTKNVICAKLGGIIELAESAKNIHLYDINDRESLARLLIAVAKENISDLAARPRVSYDDTQNYYEQLLNIYRQVLDE